MPFAINQFKSLLTNALFLSIEGRRQFNKNVRLPVLHQLYQ